MLLHFEKMGSGHPLLIFHGLYGSGDNWLSIARELSGICEIYLADMRNHGSSPHADEMNYRVMANDIAELYEHLGISKAMILGHSMGGKASMWFAADHPGMVSRLVVADISPRSYVEDVGPSNHMDEHDSILNAMMKLPLADIRSIGEAEHLLEPDIPSKRLRQFLLKNLRRGSRGYEWRINIPPILENIRNLADGLDFESLRERSVTQFPVLFLRGDKSPYIREPDIPVIRSLFPNSRIETIHNAGHWLHAEQPARFTSLVRNFILRPDTA